MRGSIALLAALALAASASAQVTTNYKYDTLGQLAKVEVVGVANICYGHDNAYNRSFAGACPDAPTANTDWLYDYTTTSSGSSFLDVLANDYDPDLPSDTLTVTGVTGSSYFSVAYGGTGLNFSGPVGFYQVTYTMKDAANNTSQAEVSFELIYCEFGAC